LVARLVDKTLLDECAACHGLWVDTAGFEALVSDGKPATIGALAGTPRTGAVSSATQIEPVTYVKCPDCTRIMNRENFGRRSGVIVDVCKPHGVWFDADELARIIHFVSAGGLDAARVREAEAKREAERAERMARAFQAQRMQQEGRTGDDRFADGIDLFTTIVGSFFDLL
jgi:Zn-finger nucleic acid-binding protein